MDGVFMLKFLRVAGAFAVIAAVIWFCGVFQDRQTLSEQIVRLHVVANSDSEEDQELKLRVRDAVIDTLSDAMTGLKDVDDVKAFLRENLEMIQSAARKILDEAGISDTVSVTLTQEAFDTRVYDTFTLPAGVYESLRITIGEGEGHNWWCVVFPRLCTPVTSSEFEDAAVGAGFSDTLSVTVSNDDGYEIRFFLLECLGRIQNFFHRD